jgi:hypothetical protein
MFQYPMNTDGRKNRSKVLYILVIFTTEYLSESSNSTDALTKFINVLILHPPRGETAAALSPTALLRSLRTYQPSLTGHTPRVPVRPR